MLSVGVDEGVSNARKYREPDSQIQLRATLETEPQDTTVSSSTLPVPVLHIEVDNFNRVDVEPLSDKECHQVFIKGYKAHTSSVFSTWVGLHTTATAIEAAGGTVRMRVNRDAPDAAHTILHLKLPVDRVEKAGLTILATTSEVPVSETQEGIVSATAQMSDEAGATFARLVVPSSPSSTARLHRYEASHNAPLAPSPTTHRCPCVHPRERARRETVGVCCP